VQARRIVGRDAELAAVERALEATVAGPVVACVVHGEAGMGKSTVWSWGVDRARQRGCRVLCCRPGEPDTGLSFAGLIELLDGFTDEFDCLPAPQRRALDVALLRAEPDRSPPGQQAAGVAVLTLVRHLAAAQPLIVAVDDSQWLDPATVDVLTYVARRLGDQPVGLLVTVRSRDAGDNAVPLGLGKFLADDQVCRVRLDRLGLVALRRLIRDRTGLVLARPDLLLLDQASGGNPLVALEIADAMGAGEPTIGRPLPVPRTLRDMADARVRALPQQGREAVLYAAALHRPTTAQLRTALPRAGQRMTGLAAAERAGIVTVEEGQIRFTHPTFASAVYASAGGEERRAVHARLAKVVADVEQRARHLALATDGPDPRVAGVLEQAAMRAYGRGAPANAVDLWDLASRRTPPGDPNLYRRRIAAARCLFSAGDSAQARAMLEDIVARVPPGPDQGRALLWLGSVLFYECGPQQAVAALLRALPLADGDPLLTGELHLRIAWFADYDLDLRLASAEAALPLLEAAQAGPALVACARIAVAYLGFLAGRGVDHDLLKQGAVLLPGGDFSWEVEFGRSMLNMLAKNLDLRGAREGWSGKLRRAREVGDEPGVPHALLHLVEVECWLGNWPLAGRYAAELIESVEQTGQRRWRGLALYAAALVAAHRGESAAALAAIADGLALADHANDSLVATLHLSVSGFHALSCGRMPDADRDLARAAELVRGMGMREPARFTFYSDQVEVALALGAHDRAADLLTELRRRSDVSPYPWLLAVTARCRAQVAMAGGDLDRALAAVYAALEAHRALPAPFELARTQLVHGQVLRRSRKRREAERALRAAEAEFTRLGAALWVPHAEAELRLLGLRRGAPHQLTPAEEQVARLVAAGRANDEVAAALFVSRRTVENHLSRIYRKLAVGSRAELARVLADAPGPTRTTSTE
jgi:DNA-binding CsgD family transcriptional regulator